LDDKPLVVVLSSPPYTINSVDGMLTVLGVAPKLGWKISIFLIDEGVHLAEKGQRPLEGVYVRTAGSHGVPFHEVNFEKALQRLLDEKVRIYACEDSCKEHCLTPSDLIDGVTMATYKELAEEVLLTKAVFFF